VAWLVGTMMLRGSPSLVITMAPSRSRSAQTFPGLAASILEKGLINPITVRPIGEDDEDDSHNYELVAGERRWRAATMAEVASIPVIVRELSDREVIEVQLIENVQREDVHPLEEAEGYQVLLDKHGYDVPQIAAKTSKSRTAVYNRLKLLRLSPTARAAFLEDKFNASIAELIARIPTSQLQDQAVAEIVRGRRASRYDLMSLGEGEPGETERPPVEAVEVDDAEDLPLTTREAQLMLQRRYMLRLELAPFDLTDAKLTEAPACSACTYRTGNQPDLFGDVPSADVCTNPPCYSEKRDADWERKAATAQAEGRTVLSPNESAGLFIGDSVRHGGPYIDLSERAEWQFQPERGGGEKTWADVLDEVALPVTLARDGGGTAHDRGVRGGAYRGLRCTGKLPRGLRESVDKPKSAAIAKVDKKAQEAALAQRRTVAARVIEQVSLEAGTDLQTLRWMAVCVVRQASVEAQSDTCKRRGIGVGSRTNSVRAPLELALLATIDDLDTVQDLLGFMSELLAWERAVLVHVPGFGDNLTYAVKALGIDDKKIAKQVAAEAKAAKKPAKKGKAA